MIENFTEDEEYRLKESARTLLENFKSDRAKMVGLDNLPDLVKQIILGQLDKKISELEAIVSGFIQ